MSFSSVSLPQRKRRVGSRRWARAHSPAGSRATRLVVQACTAGSAVYVIGAGAHLPLLLQSFSSEEEVGGKEVVRTPRRRSVMRDPPPAPRKRRPHRRGGPSTAGRVAVRAKGKAVATLLRGGASRHEERQQDDDEVCCAYEPRRPAVAPLTERLLDAGPVVRERGISAGAQDAWEATWAEGSICGSTQEAT